jgi:hypothetical protein
MLFATMENLLPIQFGKERELFENNNSLISTATRTVDIKLDFLSRLGSKLYFLGIRYEFITLIQVLINLISVHLAHQNHSTSFQAH